MNNDKPSINDHTAEENLLQLLTLEVPQAEWIIRRLASGDINLEQARLEMHRLCTSDFDSVKH